MTLIIGLLGIQSCGAGNEKKSANPEASAITLAFDADSAYQYTLQQTLFGPRVPETNAHKKCCEYLVSQMKSFGAQVNEQNCDVITWDGKTLKATNIIASYQPGKTPRILLCSHWDSRPWADHDPNPANHKKAIDGANDGASGVGVLMELARQLQKLAAEKKLPDYGVDIVFLDAEDLGTPEWANAKDNENSWCLGTQFWASEARKKGYTAEFGILLDMVGRTSPNFMWDYYSMQYAPQVLQKVWSAAAALGYNASFVPSEGGAITDDHLYVNRIAGIPCIDIIDYTPGSQTGFVPEWHTMADKMDKIDKNSLKMVGETLLHVIYKQ